MSHFPEGSRAWLADDDYIAAEGKTPAGANVSGAVLCDGVGTGDVVSVYDVATPASHAPLLVFPDRGSGRTTRKGGRRR